jgi:hypothetical protein
MLIVWSINNLLLGRLSINSRLRPDSAQCAGGVALTAEASENIYERRLTAVELTGRAAVDMLAPALGYSSGIGKCLDSFKSGAGRSHRLIGCASLQGRDSSKAVKAI